MVGQQQSGSVSSLSIPSNLPNPTTAAVGRSNTNALVPSKDASRTNLTDAGPNRRSANGIDAGAGITVDGPLEHAIDKLIAAGALSPVGGQLRWAPARHQPAWRHNCPSIEIGRLVANEALCGHADHRHSDWKAQDGRVICGICHPPAQHHALPGASGQEGRDSRQPSEGLEA